MRLICERQAPTLLLHFAAVLLFFSGCGPELRRPRRICPGAKSLFESLSALRLRSENAVPLKANGQCRLEYYADGKTHKENFPVRLWVNPPFEFCLQGDVAFDPKGVVVGSNEQEFWLWVKPKEVSSYWWGEWDRTSRPEKLPINPRLVLDAIGIVEVDDEEGWLLSNEGAFDVLTERNGEAAIIRKIYIHSCNYLVWRIEYLGTGGEAVASVELYEYKEVLEGFSVPTVIVISKRTEDDKTDSVRISISSVKGAKFTEKAFNRPEPKGFKHVEKI